MPTTRKIAAFILFVCLAPALFAQGGATGAISGTVLDQSGGFVAGAHIAIINDATGATLRQLTSDTSGLFTANLLPVGVYTIQISATGFASIKIQGIHVDITETTRVTAELKVSKSTETIEVQSQAATVNTTDATTGELVGPATINTLPLATRNFQQILTLSAGASSDLNNASQLGRGQVFIHVNGGREDNNNYLIDGISVADYAFGELTYTPLPNPDAIQEFKVSTSLYDASQGRNGGGNINATLKSGTAQFHGDAWEYFRNTVLDANDFFLNRAGESCPVIKQNVFGGDFGGPLGNATKFGFFYVNYQGTRQRSGASAGTRSRKFPDLPVAPASGHPGSSKPYAAASWPHFAETSDGQQRALPDVCGHFRPFPLFYLRFRPAAYFWTAPQRVRMYWRGVTFITLRKWRAKWLWSAKPTVDAASAQETPARSNWQARFTRN